MTPRDPAKPDPSMEDILASIRDILKEDEAAHEPLDLTEAMLVSDPEPVPAPPPSPPVEVAEEPALVPPPPEVLPPQPAPSQPVPPKPAPQPTSLLAPAVAAAAAAALGELAKAVAGDRGAPVARGGSASIEDVVREELRPLLKAWLDQHLPGMVEHIVKAEIARLMHQGRD